MQGPQHANSTQSDQESVRALHDTLADLNREFDTYFCVWRKDLTASHWKHIGHNDCSKCADFPFQLNARFSSILMESSVRKQCLVNEFDGQAMLFFPCQDFLPQSNENSQLVAVCCLPDAEMTSLQRQADLTLRLLREQRRSKQLEELNECYADQVSYDFEELFWLRNLAQHIEYCGVDNPIAEVTEKVLPSLCDLIKTESLIFFPEIGDNQIPNLKPYVAGNQDVNLDHCRDIVNQYRAAALVQPVVNNNDFHNQNINIDNAPFSFALVPVSKDTYHAGWLLAYNRLTPPLADYQMETRSVSENSLGTFEVGLLAASGTLLANHARNTHLYKEQEHLIIGVVRSLINTVDAKDSYTCGHGERVALMAKRVARQLRMSDQECERIYMTGLLHDIGKIGIPDEILCKKGKLTEEEFDVIKKHPEIGYSILKHLKPLEYVLPGIMHHHESYDGTGYPMQLKGDDIPLEGRILAVVDAYDAMTSCRPYRTAMPFEKAESILLENSGIQWDPKIVKCFFAVLKDIHQICRRTEVETKGLFNHESRPNIGETGDSISSAVSMTRTE